MKRERGIAIITAMLIIAIATVLAVQMIWETSLDFRRTETMMLRDQAIEYSLAAEDAAIALLRDDARSATPYTCPAANSDLGPAFKGQTLERSGVKVAFRLSDLQGPFNLNNLIDGRGHKDPVVHKQFQRLLVSIDADTRIADAVVDWIDPDTVPELEGAEDDIYTALTPAYRTANFWFTSVSELLAVQGVTPDVYAALMGRDPKTGAQGPPLVAALPGTGQFTKLNLNTMPDRVFASLLADSADKSATAADLLGSSTTVASASAACFEDTKALAGKVDPALAPYVGVASNYFGLNVTVSIGTYRLSMYSLIERNGQSVAARVRSFDVN